MSFFESPRNHEGREGEPGAPGAEQTGLSGANFGAASDDKFQEVLERSRARWRAVTAELVGDLREVFPNFELTKSDRFALARVGRLLCAMKADESSAEKPSEWAISRADAERELRAIIAQATTSIVWLQNGRMPPTELASVLPKLPVHLDAMKTEFERDALAEVLADIREVRMERTAREHEVQLASLLIRFALKASPYFPILFESVRDNLVLARAALNPTQSTGLRIGVGIDKLMILELPAYLAMHPEHDVKVSEFLRTIGIVGRLNQEFMRELRVAADALRTTSVEGAREQPTATSNGTTASFSAKEEAPHSAATPNSASPSRPLRATVKPTPSTMRSWLDAAGDAVRRWRRLL